MTFVLDTDAYSAFNRGNKQLKEFFNVSNDIIIPLIVVGELRAGFAAGKQRQVNERLLQRFLDAPNVSTVSITDQTTILFAEIYFRLRQKGRPIGTNDLWIAATSLEQDQPLLTLDSDFSWVPDLMLVQIPK